MCIESSSSMTNPVGLIWDAHVHAYPDDVVSDPRIWAKKRGETHWWELVSQPIQGWYRIEELIKEMDASGVERSLLLGWYWQNPVTCLEWNEWLLKVLNKYPDRFIGMLSAHPQMDLDGFTKDALDHSQILGMGECLPQVQGSFYGDPDWIKLCDEVFSREKMINLHITEPVGHDYKGRVETPFNELIDLIERCPDGRWILSHWGGGLPVYFLNSRLKKLLSQVWFDCSASPLLYSDAIWKVMIEAVGPERILFGSDFPLNLYPSKDDQVKMGRFIGSFTSNVSNWEQQQKIAFQNLKSLSKTNL